MLRYRRRPAQYRPHQHAGQRNQRDGPEDPVVVRLIEPAAGERQNHGGFSSPRAGCHTGDARGSSARVRPCAGAQSQHLESAGHEHAPEEQREHAGGRRDQPHESERDHEDGEQQEHEHRTILAGGESIEDPAPDEVADLPAERWNPQHLSQVRLRKLHHAIQIQRAEIENRRDRDRSERVARDERPEAALERIERCRASASPSASAGTAASRRRATGRSTRLRAGPSRRTPRASRTPPPPARPRPARRSRRAIRRYRRSPSRGPVDRAEANRPTRGSRRETSRLRRGPGTRGTPRSPRNRTSRRARRSRRSRSRPPRSCRSAARRNRAPRPRADSRSCRRWRTRRRSRRNAVRSDPSLKDGRREHRQDLAIDV